MATKAKSDATAYDLFQVEDRVKHPKFGEGQIIQRTGIGEQTKFLVAFAEVGEKHLLGKYAKLKKIRPVEETPAEKKEEE